MTVIEKFHVMTDLYFCRCVSSFSLFASQGQELLGESSKMEKTPRLDVNAPLWDQGTFYGRFRHFFWMTNPLNCLHTKSELEGARDLVERYRTGAEPPGTREEQVKHAMKLYASSFHPDSGELQNVFGRMSFQVPGGMLITGAMLQFYKSVPQVVFWQWFNQVQ